MRIIRAAVDLDLESVADAVYVTDEYVSWEAYDLDEYAEMLLRELKVRGWKRN